MTQTAVVDKSDVQRVPKISLHLINVIKYQYPSKYTSPTHVKSYTSHIKTTNACGTVNKNRNGMPSIMQKRTCVLSLVPLLIADEMRFH